MFTSMIKDIQAKILGTPWKNTRKRRILHTSLHVCYEKLWHWCFNSVQGTPPPPPNNVDKEGTDKGHRNQHYKGRGEGRSAE